MSTILIADDEAPIREWLTFCIQRSGSPVHVIGAASSGTEALELLREKHPDILMTDIRMPGMDGLELIEQARAASPETVIVALSSHDDFDYVRRAMKSGAREYILKSEITEGMLKDLLRRLGNASGQTNARVPDFGQVLARRALLLSRLMWGPAKESHSEGKLPAGHPERHPADDVRTASLEEFMQDCGISLADAPLFTIALRFDRNSMTFDAFSEYPDQLLAYSNRITNPAWFPSGSEGAVLTANISSTLSPTMRTSVLRSFAKALAGQYHSSAGVSRVTEGLSTLGQSIREAFTILEYTFYSGTGTCLFPEDLPAETDLGAAREISRRFVAACIGMDHVGAERQLAELEEELTQNRPGPVHAVKALLEGLVRAVSGEQPQPCSLIQIPAATLRDSVEYVRSFLRTKNSFHGTSGVKMEYSGPVRIVMQNYELGPLDKASLAHAAALVRLNPDYFSRIFKEETGMNFVVWLSDLKVRRAAELLSATDMKVHEIADQVGYSNLGYFSKVFKRKTGCNPFEYRRHAESGFHDQVGK